MAKKPLFAAFFDIIKGFFRTFAPVKVLYPKKTMMQNMPTATKNLLIINIVAYLLNYALQGQLNDLLGLHFFMASEFHVYQLVTYMFMHGSFMHILMNMFMLWMFGAVIERVLGTRRYLVFYFVCGLGAAFCQEVAQFVDYSLEGLAAYQSVSVNVNGVVTAMPTDAYINLWNTVGASGAIYGVLLAFGMLYPEERIFIFPLPVPIKAKWFVLIYAALELFMAWHSSGDGVAHLAHLGGMAFGYLLIRHWRTNPQFGMYDYSSGSFKKLRRRWDEKRRQRQEKARKESANDGWNEAARNPDWDYNARRTATQAEVDRILEKIRQSGYDSLTAREKQTLFDESRRS